MFFKLHHIALKELHPVDLACAGVSNQIYVQFLALIKPGAAAGSDVQVQVKS